MVLMAVIGYVVLACAGIVGLAEVDARKRERLTKRRVLRVK